MKKLVFILAVAIISLQSCNAGQAKSNGNNETINSAPVETVSEMQATAGEGGTVKLTKAKFLAEVWDYENSPKEWKYKGTKPAMIDFYADWCGPCRTAAPILEEVSKEYAGKITIYKIDTEVERELAAVFGVQGIPAFLYIPVNGKPSMTSGIARTKEDTKKMFRENIENMLLAKN